MSDNILTPMQDLLTREFFREVANDPSCFPSDPVGQGNTVACILRMLNYQYVSGKFVDPAKISTRPLNGQVDLPCEWEEDEAKAIAAVAEADRALEAAGVVNGPSNSTSSNKADSRESSTDTEVRETLLREDV